MVNQKHETKVYYSSVIPIARQDIDLDTAFFYFSKNRAYQNTVKQKSYADVLKFGKIIPVNVKPSNVQHEG